MQMIDVQPLVGPGQQRCRRQFANLGAVGGDALDNRCLAVDLGGTVLASGDPDTRHQPAQVPFPAARVRLIEIVEVDDQVALGGGVETEVAQVRVAADDRRDAGGGQLGNVLGHDDSGAAQESVGIGRHPADPQWDQPVQPALMRLHDLLHRVGSVGRRRPVAQRAAGHRCAAVRVPSGSDPRARWAGGAARRTLHCPPMPARRVLGPARGCSPLVPSHDADTSGM